MSHPKKVWLVFAAALVVVIAAMGYLSVMAVQLDRAQRAAQHQAEQEEAVRLALWRMDGVLTALVAQESARPTFEYQPFYAPNDARGATYTLLAPGSVVLPSPLLWQDPPLVRLHFRLEADGKVSSPQVVLDPAKNPATAGRLSPDRTRAATRRLKQLQAILKRGTLAEMLPEPPAAPVGNKDAPLIALSNTANYKRQDQRFMNGMEFVARNSVNVQAAGQYNAYAQSRDLYQAQVQREGAARAVWLGEELLLARRAARGARTWVVGCWLDWPAMRSWLLESVGDLLPDAQLEAAPGDVIADESRRLAALPVRLKPGAAPLSETESNPVYVSLAAAWGGVLIAAAAVAIMLHGVLSLSERRATFATAVTHELRTPLTSMRMYTEMLAGGQVAEAAKQAQYLNTLDTQTGRLCGLVENVLDYARIEARSKPVALDKRTVGELLDRATPRLQQRAEQADMQLVCEIDQALRDLPVRIDTLAVERILLNLVDNACKYAAHAADRRIEITARRRRRRVLISVRDHGPGIDPADAGRIFRPFHKARRDAAGTHGGVGLGLAISRRAARRLGGDLAARPGDDGACFVLALPRAR